VLTVGTAGGWNRAGASIGDVYLAWDRFVCHDRRIDLPGFDAFGRADLPAADLRAHAGALGCRLGVVTTGDSLDESPEDAARILASGAEVKEMEAAAVAWIGSLHDVPVGAVKAITDLVDSPVATAEQFSANLATAADALQRTTLALLARLGEEIGADV
jgi:nucleoside phosphorylase